MLRDADGAIDALFRRDAAEEGEITGLDRLRHQEPLGQAVMHRAHPMRLRQRPPLRIGDRHHRHRVEGVEHRLMLGQIEPAVQRGHERRRLAREQRERIIVEMKMQDVEIARALIDALQHHHVQPIGIAHRAVEPQRPRPRRFELGRGLRIARGKQRDLVAERDQFLGQPRHDPFGSTIELGRYRLRQRGDLRDMHRIDLSVGPGYGFPRRPAISRRKDNNEPRPKYFNSGVELIFPKIVELFCVCKVVPNARNRRSTVTGATTCRHRMPLDMVRRRDASQNFFVRSDRTFASSRRCDPV